MADGGWRMADGGWQMALVSCQRPWMTRGSL
jgi:hypothetical protein